MREASRPGPTIEERMLRWYDYCMSKGHILHRMAVHHTDYKPSLEAPGDLLVVSIGVPR